MKTPGRMHDAVVLSKKKKDTLWKPPSLRHLICTMVHAWHWIAFTWSFLYCLGSFVLDVWEWEQVKRKTPLGRLMTWIWFNDLFSWFWHFLWFHNTETHVFICGLNPTKYELSAAICDILPIFAIKFKIFLQSHIESFFLYLNFEDVSCGMVTHICNPTQEVQIRRVTAGSKPEKIVFNSLSQKNPP
jgi:hypothetical protein